MQNNGRIANGHQHSVFPSLIRIKVAFALSFGTRPRKLVNSPVHVPGRVKSPVKIYIRCDISPLSRNHYPGHRVQANLHTDFVGTRKNFVRYWYVCMFVCVRVFEIFCLFRCDRSHFVGRNSNQHHPVIEGISP